MTKVVIIDDSHDACNIYGDTLQCAGYTTECIFEEEKAVEVVCKEKPDLVLLDILMPKINGLHLLDLILADPCNKNTRVVILTQLSDSKIRQKALAKGALDYIVKSQVGMTEFLQRIDKVLSV